jgi:uncharacterized protein
VRHILFAALALLAACTPAADGAAQQSAAAVSATLDRPAWVVDTADMLAPAQEAEFAERLRDFERRTQHQVIVVTVPTTSGRDIADYARDLGNRWGVGRRGHDDGIIVLLARDDRKLRIAVGDGLTHRLPNQAAAQIIVGAMVPRLRAGDHAGAVRAGLAAILARLEP